MVVYNREAGKHYRRNGRGTQLAAHSSSSQENACSAGCNTQGHAGIRSTPPAAAGAPIRPGNARMG
eukprot:134688-Alexandrium_andersonii.AAC.1